MKNNFYLSIAFVIAAFSINAQDIHFSNPVQWDWEKALSNGCINCIIDYLDQALIFDNFLMMVLNPDYS